MDSYGLAGGPCRAAATVFFWFVFTQVLSHVSTCDRHLRYLKPNHMPKEKVVKDYSSIDRAK